MKISMSWSGGKDSALALNRLMQNPDLDVINLHTTLDSKLKRVSLHGIHETIIENQAESIGLPLVKLYLDSSMDHGNYNLLMKNFCEDLVLQGVEAIGYGDIFLEDLRAYRDKMLATAGLRGIYPLWKEGSLELLEEFWDGGFKSLLCSADTQFFDSKDMGANLDKRLLAQLPAEVDPCGENGEFHTITTEGPIFRRPITLSAGEVVKKVYDFKTKDENGQIRENKSAFWFCDFKLA